MSRLTLNTILTFKGTKDYTTKDNRQIQLYTFTDEDGNLKDVTLPNELNCEVGTRCGCKFQYSEYKDKKTGEWKSGLFLKSVEPIIEK